MTIEQILTEAFLLGCDLEAHAEERHTNPDNYDAVCEYVAEEMARLKQEVQMAL